jgi:hypothetical protein
VNRRSWMLLAALAAALLLAWGMGGFGDGGGGGGGDEDFVTAPARSGSRARGTARRGGARQQGEDGTQVVALASPDMVDVPESYEPGRNPFRYFVPPPPPPSPPPPPPPPPPPVVPQPPQPPPPPPKPQPPPVDVAYLGSFGPASAPIAVFTNGEEIFNVRTGEVIAGKFQVVQIGYESVDLAFVGFPDAPPARLPVGSE